MRRNVVIVVLLAAFAAALIGSMALLAARLDWNRAKPWLVQAVSRATGRSIAIDGDLTVTWQIDPDVRGWQHLIPVAHVSAAKVRIGNPQWSKAPAFATAQQAEFDLALLPLLAHTISVPSLRFTDPVLDLERASGRRNNWTFGAESSGAEAAWRAEFGRIRLARGKIEVHDEVKHLAATFVLDKLQVPVSYAERAAQQEAAAQREDAARVGAGVAREIAGHEPARGTARVEPQHYVFGWTVEGNLHGKPVKGEGAVGGILALRHPEQPFPLQADIRLGDTRIAFVGTLTDPADPQGLDLRLWLSGSSLAHLFEVFDVTLPESRPFASSGHLIGRFGRHDVLRYENFEARVGASDLSGELSYETREPRPLLSGRIDSTLLQFRDLAPLVGANGTRGDATAAAQSGKVMPEEPFRPERWRAMDADVRFSGDRVVRDTELPIHKFATRVRMDGGVLTLEPLAFRYAFGDIEAHIRMDGRSAPIKGTIQATAKGVQLNRVLKNADNSQLDLGTASATAKLQGSGNSIGGLLGAANGEVRALLDGGSISKGLIETISLNVPNIMLTRLFGDRQVDIQCAAADFEANNGSYVAKLFVVDTDAARINVTGNLDLADEKLDLTLHPDTKGLRLLSLRSPIHVTGTFAHPQGGVDKGVLLARSAGAVGLAVVATPAAALLPLTQTSAGGDDDRCRTLLASMQRTRPAQAEARKK